MQKNGLTYRNSLLIIREETLLTSDEEKKKVWAATPEEDKKVTHVSPSKTKPGKLARGIRGRTGSYNLGQKPLDPSKVKQLSGMAVHKKTESPKKYPNK